MNRKNAQGEGGQRLQERIRKEVSIRQKIAGQKNGKIAAREGRKKKK